MSSDWFRKEIYFSSKRVMTTSSIQIITIADFWEKEQHNQKWVLENHCVTKPTYVRLKM